MSTPTGANSHPDPNPNPHPHPHPNLDSQVGEGGFGRVFRAAALPSLPGGTGEVAIKKGSSVHSDTDLHLPTSPYISPISPLYLPGSSVHSDTDLADLHHEVTLATSPPFISPRSALHLRCISPSSALHLLQVTLLAGCSHPHLLPLLGHCLDDPSAPCLLFPLMRGGSLRPQRVTKTASATWGGPHRPA